MKTVKDLMTTEPLYLTLHDSLSQAINIFLDKKMHTLPVIGNDKSIVGVLTEAALVKILIQGFNQKIDSQATILQYKALLSAPTVILEDEPISELIKLCLSYPHSRFLVVNERKNLRGVISPRDIIRLIKNQHGL